jgi:hypothetical protein
MPEKQKPDPKTVRIAARVLKHPETATVQDAQHMAARILDDQKNAPQPHKPKAKPPSPPKRTVGSRIESPLNKYFSKPSSAPKPPPRRKK